MRVFLVSFAFPPIAGSHVTRVVALSEMLGKRAEVIGFASEVGPGIPMRDDSVRVSVPVIRTFPGLVHYLVYRRTRREGVNMAVKVPGFVSRLRNSVKRAMISAYRSAEVVDSLAEWIPFLALGIRRRLDTDDVLVSTSMPNSCHVASRLALVGRQNLWWADFGDPWTLDASRPRRGVRALLERQLEFQVIRRANLVTFTTERCLEDYVLRYPRFASKMSLARMGSDLDSSIGPEDPKVPTVLYAGSLPTENRDIGPFLQAVSMMPHIRFVFAGPAVHTVRAHVGQVLPDNLVCYEWLSHEEFHLRLREASVGVIFGNRNPQQVPGKVYQYLSSAPRILYVSLLNQDQDETARILRGHALMVANDASSISRGLDELLCRPRRTGPYGSDYSWASVLEQPMGQFLAMRGE